MSVIPTWVMFTGNSILTYPSRYFAATLLAPAFYLAAAFYLFVFGQRLADMAIPSNRTYCAECGYQLQESLRVCPECGTDRLTGNRKAGE